MVLCRLCSFYVWLACLFRKFPVCVQRCKFYVQLQPPRTDEMVNNWLNSKELEQKSIYIRSVVKKKKTQRTRRQTTSSTSKCSLISKIIKCICWVLTLTNRTWAYLPTCTKRESWTPILITRYHNNMRFSYQWTLLNKPFVKFHTWFSSFVLF